jgi:hypothetical protein
MSPDETPALWYGIDPLTEQDADELRRVLLLTIGKHMHLERFCRNMNQESARVLMRVATENRALRDENQRLREVVGDEPPPRRKRRTHEETETA